MTTDVVPTIDCSNSSVDRLGNISKPQRRINWDRWIAVVSVLAAITAVLDSRNQAGIQRQQMELDHRPRLAISSMDGKIAAGRPLDVQCRIDSLGKSPATIVEEACDTTLMPLSCQSVDKIDSRIRVNDLAWINDNDTLKKGNKKQTVSIVPPGQHELFVATGKTNLSQREAARIEAGILIPIIVHRLTYLDGTNKRSVRSCFSYDARTKTWEKQGQFDRMD